MKRKRFLDLIAPNADARQREADQELAVVDGRLLEARRAVEAALRRLKVLEARVELMRLGNGH